MCCSCILRRQVQQTSPFTESAGLKITMVSSHDLNRATVSLSTYITYQTDDFIDREGEACLSPSSTYLSKSGSAVQPEAEAEVHKTRISPLTGNWK